MIKILHKIILLIKENTLNNGTCLPRHLLINIRLVKIYKKVKQFISEIKPKNRCQKVKMYYLFILRFFCDNSAKACIKVQQFPFKLGLIIYVF